MSGVFKYTWYIVITYAVNSPNLLWFLCALSEVVTLTHNCGIEMCSIMEVSSIQKCPERERHREGSIVFIFIHSSPNGNNI